MLCYIIDGITGKGGAESAVEHGDDAYKQAIAFLPLFGRGLAHLFVHEESERD